MIGRLLVLLCAIAACERRDTEPAPLPTPTPPTPTPTPAPAKPLTCDEARPLYGEMLRAHEAAYEAALAQAKLQPVKLEHVWLRDYRGTQPDYNDLIEATISHRGKQRRALVGAGYDRANRDPQDIALVTADGKTLRLVRKNLRPTSTRTIAVEACQWGCFGRGPSGAERQPDDGHDAWLLDADHVYQGEIVVDLTAPQIIFEPTQRDCSMPG